MSKKFTWSEVELEETFPHDFYAYYGDEELGYIGWYPKWKKWVWNQGLDIIMSKSCLQNVLNKLKELGRKSGK